MFSLRSGSNRLRIETGRWKRPKEKEEERLCLVCNKNKIENEVHFVAECEKYEDFRQYLISETLRISNGLVNLSEMENRKDDIFWIVAVGWGGGEQWERICKAALNFVYRAMKRRANLLKDRIV